MSFFDVELLKNFAVRVKLYWFNECVAPEII